MVILELFDAVYPYDVERETPTIFRAIFTPSNNHPIKVMIDGGGGTWDLGFSQNAGTAEIPRWTYNTTAHGDEYRIFGTVMKILADFIKKYSPEEVAFTAEKDNISRARLYDKMVKKYIPSGYEHNINHDSSDYRSYFVLKRK